MVNDFAIVTSEYHTAYYYDYHGRMCRSEALTIITAEDKEKCMDGKDGILLFDVIWPISDDPIDHLPSEIWFPQNADATDGDIYLECVYRITFKKFVDVLFNGYYHGYLGFVARDLVINTSRGNISPISFKFKPICQLKCPENGNFIGYKKVIVSPDSELTAIAKLEIPEDALRSSGFGNKCRCSKAKVLKLMGYSSTRELSPAGYEVRHKSWGTSLNEAWSRHDPNFAYTVGEEVVVDDFETNRFKECAPGIHFFMTLKEAIEYDFH